MKNISVKKTDWDPQFPWSILTGTDNEYDAYEEFSEALRIAVNLSNGFENPELGIYREGCIV